jgi:hypothetical protein
MRRGERGMSTLATAVIILAIAGAVASWIAGATFYLRTLRSLQRPEERRLRWLALVAWPFVGKRLQGAAAEHASKVNKALVAFFACLTVAIAATSVATNLSRLSR